MKSIDQKPIIWLEGLPEAPQRHPGRVWGWVDGFPGRSDLADRSDHDFRRKNDRMNCGWILRRCVVLLIKELSTHSIPIETKNNRDEKIEANTRRRAVSRG